MRFVTLFLIFINWLAAAQLKIVHTFPAPASKPTGLTVVDSNLFLADIGTNLIYKMDKNTGKVIDTIPAPKGATINGLAWDGSHLWCSDNGSNNLILMLDTTSGQVLKSFPSPAPSPRGLTFDGHDIWLQDSGADKIYCIDTTTGQVKKSFHAPHLNGRGLTLMGKYFWAADQGRDELYLIDTLRQKVVFVFDAPFNYPYGLTNDGRYLWHVDYNSDTIYQLDPQFDQKVVYYDSLQVAIRYTVTLRNVGSSVMDIKTYLACPPSLPYQELLDSPDYFDPPQKFLIDGYGQKMAYYRESLDPGEEVKHGYLLHTNLRNALFLIHPDSVGTKDEIPDSILSLYTKDGDKYQIYNETVRQARDEALQGETNFYWRVRRLHDFVLNKLSYVNDSHWDDVPTLLQTGQGSCSEYSFLFIALCRSAGIPARYEAGGHLRDDIPYKDTIFHRWAQVYFPRYGWVVIDCTWDDRSTPAEQAYYFGRMSTQVFTTTIGGGGDVGLNWTYNSANSNSGGKREREKLMEWLPFTTAIETQQAFSPYSWQLLKLYPNPFNLSVNIEYHLPHAKDVQIRIFDVKGRLVRDLPSVVGSQGKILWDGRDQQGKVVSSGNYFVTVQSSKKTLKGKLILIK